VVHRDQPRLWGSIHLAVASGVDFPALLYIAATEGPDEARRRLSPWREGVVARWYWGIGSRRPALCAAESFCRPLKMVLPGGTDTYDDFTWTIGSLPGAGCLLPDGLSALAEFES